MSFWDDFKTLANYRISYHIQNIFIDSWFKAKNESAKRKESISLNNNKEKIVDAVYNNKFSRSRKKPK